MSTRRGHDERHGADAVSGYRYRSQFIDDSAAVDYDTEGKAYVSQGLFQVDDSVDDDEDSYEGQVRQQDQRDFLMDEIEAGHEQRLHFKGPYRIPPRLLQSGAATTSRGQDDSPDPPSRPTSPPAPCSPLRTPLFLADPDSRGVTAGLDREFTPMLLPPLMLPEVCSSPFFFVRVEQGRYAGRGGTIVKVLRGGGLEIFETAHAESLRVRSADAAWDPQFNEFTESRGMYTLSSTLSPAQELSKQDEEKFLKLMHTGQRFLGIEVQVVGKSVHKNLRGVVVGDHDSEVRAKRWGRRRGNRLDCTGIIVTIQKEMSNVFVLVDVPIEQIHHLHTTLSLAQVALLPKGVLKSYESATLHARVEAAEEVWRRTPPPNFESATDRAQLAGGERRTPPPNEYAMDVQWGLPKQPIGPILLGEDTGEWMCIEDLAGKRFDIQLLGTRNLRGKASDTVRKLDGTFGHLLPAGPILSTSKKVDVYGLGKTRTKHAIDVTCVKPRRKDDNGRCLTEITTRVVIVGPDADMSSADFRGRYGLTVPDMWDADDVGAMRGVYGGASGKCGRMRDADDADAMRGAYSGGVGRNAVECGMLMMRNPYAMRGAYGGARYMRENADKCGKMRDADDGDVMLGAYG